jgi:diguanylate cyclase
MVRTASPPRGPLPFREACELVVDHLKREIPLAFWSVSHYDGERQLYLCVQDDAYGKSDGDSHAWSDSFCQHMVAGVAPQIAPDAMAVAEYAAAGVARVMPIGSYIGVPIRGANGDLFGTICGMDPHRQPGSLLDHAPLLNVCATLLSEILYAEQLRLEAIDREAELQWSAFHDDLTGLPNRAMFLAAVGRALTEAVQTGREVAVLLIDLDDFKAVNDAFGHAGGDGLLVQVSRRLRGALAPGDTLARLSSDEFAVLAASADSGAVAERIREALHEPFAIAGTSIAVSGSVGATDLGHDPSAETVDSLLAHADIAMYHAKRTGKSRSVCYESRMTMPGVAAIRLREPLRAAIEAGAVEAYYHAVVDLHTARPVGFEALARWRHDGELLGPDVFIPVAERSGLLPALTEHMLDRSCAQVSAWSDEVGHHDLRIGVNLSPDSISDPGLPGRVAEHLRRHAVEPHQLVLEVTEEALLVDLATATTVARALGDLGVRVVLDDFGTGYSSLLHLRNLPLHSIKVDRRFVQDIDSNPEAQRFLRALVNLSRDLELALVVEGVERESQACTLRRLECDFAQGHLYGRPAPASEITLHRA